MWFVFPRMMARRMIRHAVRVRAAELYADEARAQGVPESGIAMLCEWIVR